MTAELRIKIVLYVGFAAALSLLTTAAYVATAKFLKDRQVALARLTRPDLRTPWRAEGTTRRGPEANGVRPSFPPPIAPSAAASGEAAIQRQLRTLDEINRINEMNRRLMDQQRRSNQH